MDGQGTDGAEALTAAVLTASRLLVAIAVRSLAAAHGRVTLAQFRMLVVLATRGECNLVSLADNLAVNPSTALRMVDRLVDGGFVSRRVNPASRREVLLRVTPAGRKIVDEVTAHRREEISVIVARMSAQNRAGLVRALRAFAKAGGELPAGERDLTLLGWDLEHPAIGLPGSRRPGCPRLRSRRPPDRLLSRGPATGRPGRRKHGPAPRIPRSPSR